MSGTVFLSHILDEATPGYGGKHEFTRSARGRICDGASANSENWQLSNHVGTHVDSPLHFADGALAIDSYSSGDWIFRRPFLWNLPLEGGVLAGVEHGAEAIPRDCDLVLLKSGFERFRQEASYWENNPGLSVGLGEWLRRERPSVRAIGVDFLSATAYQRRPEGREAHRAFLDPARPGKPLLIIEDMALGALTAKPSRVIVAPVRVRGADGAPVTIIAEFGVV